MTFKQEPNGYGVYANNLTTAKPMDLVLNSTWIMLNGTRSISKVKFTETSYDVCMGSFVRELCEESQHWQGAGTFLTSPLLLLSFIV
jgi:hypothetical protein